MDFTTKGGAHDRSPGLREHRGSREAARMLNWHDLPTHQGRTNHSASTEVFDARICNQEGRNRELRTRICSGAAVALATLVAFALVWLALAVTCSLVLGRVVICPWWHMW